MADEGRTGPVRSGLEYEAAPGSPRPGRARPIGDEAELRALLDPLLQRQLQEGRLAGAAIVVVHDGAVRFRAGYGQADVRTQAKVCADTTLFRAGSVSKLITWTAVMQLAERQKLSLDTDVNEYLAAAGFALPPAFSRPVTLKNLMTHTPGLEANTYYGHALSAAPALLSRFLPARMPARIWAPAQTFTEGGAACYSNWGGALAGRIVELVAQQPFDEYVEQRIFKPLGMESSTFREPLPAHLAPFMAAGHRNDGSSIEPQAFEYNSGLGPAGSFSTTVADMAQFMIAQLDGGQGRDGRILEDTSVQRMQQRVYAPHRHVNGATLGFYETYLNGRRTVGHGGLTLYFRSEMMLLPEARFGVFVMYNTMPGPDMPGAVMQCLMDAYFPAERPDFMPPADFPARARRYIGSYAPTLRSYRRVEKLLAFSPFEVTATPDDRLRISNIDGIADKDWVEVAADTFRRADGAETIAFVPPAPDRVTHIVGPCAIAPSYRLPPSEREFFRLPEFTPPYARRELWFTLVGLVVLAAVASIVTALLRWGFGTAEGAHGLAAVLGGINVAIVAALQAARRADPYQAVIRPPWTLSAAQALALVSLALGAGVLLLACQAWLLASWTPYARIEYTILAGSSAAFLWWLRHWNVIGPIE